MSTERTGPDKIHFTYQWKESKPIPHLIWAYESPCGIKLVMSDDNWTLEPEEVTCPECKEILAARVMERINGR